MRVMHVRARIAGLAAAGIVGVTASGSALQSQQAPSPQVVVTDYDMPKAALPPPLSPEELAGKKLFVQRCALCHDLLGQPATSTVGPWVDAETVKAKGDAAVRQQINTGSRRMPGWRYTFTPSQIDQVIAYLKTVTPDQKPKAPGQVVTPLD